VSQESKPKDAAAVILLRHNTDQSNPEVFWVQRSERLSFLGGFYAFPGGQLDLEDAAVSVLSCEDPQQAAMISCAARELFEELSVLAVRGSESLTKGQRASLLDDLESRRMSWPELLAHYNLSLNARDYTFVGRWVTPPFSSRRFDTWFFLVECPARQQPELKQEGELAGGEWISSRDAYSRWERSEVLLVEPILHALKTLSGGISSDVVDRFLSTPHAHGEPARRIEFQPNFIFFPVRTPTRPPATHTNCYLIYTTRELLVIDPGSPYEDEQLALAHCVEDLLSGGRSFGKILLTHVHPDHVGGVNALRARFNGNVRTAAHQLTAEALGDTILIDEFINDGDLIELAGEPQIRLQAMHTPGHARGHLCFLNERTGTLITGDNIVGLGSVLIDPPEGNMTEYLQSLERMRSVPNLTVLFGGHGPAMANPYAKLTGYINHRLSREQMILDAVREGATAPAEIVAVAYTDVSPKAHSMAERAVIAHLEKLEADGLIVTVSDGKYKLV